MAKNNILVAPRLKSALNWQEQSKEYERRIDVLTICLEEKVLENNQILKQVELLTNAANNERLFEQIRELERDSKEKNDELEEAHRELRKMEKKKDAAQREAEETKRQLAEAREKIRELQKGVPDTGGDPGTPTKATPGAVAGMDERYKKKMERDKKRMDDLLYTKEEEIDKLNLKVKDREKKLRAMTAKLNKEQERRLALVESNEEYEKRHQQLEKDLLDSLRKEGERRMEAEYWQDNMRKKVKVLKKKLKKKEGGEAGGDDDSDSDGDV
eukprot:TRINITY_DN3982_c0_g1_i1.p1 TRINITY_DN3982_c0_g1~~TRINITY_DN3982_c0_g1_i1.p1  ORF type:complete len:271 (-),score=99.60 TRINITY_DN3982_c0_g1_i1:136-948(-)